MNKTAVAIAAGIDISAPADLPVSTRPSHSKDIGAEIVRRAAYGSVNVDSIIKYLDTLRMCGIIARSALAANLSYSSILKLRERDSQFAAEEQMAKELWIAEKIDDPIRKFGIEGVNKVLINQKTGETVLGEKVIYPQLALAYARKFDPAYREKQEIDMKHSGGVVVVTAPAMNTADWNARAAERNAQRREVIDMDSLPAAGGPDSIPSAQPNNGGS